MHHGQKRYYVESILKPQKYNSFSHESMGKSLETIFSRVLREQEKYYDVFVSHSSKDKSAVLRIVEMIEEAGYKAYVDWIEDSDSDRNDISEKIKTAIRKSTKLLYVHSRNSINSKWTPWEIGCFDSSKGANNIIIFPLLGDQNLLPDYVGQEYLQQYNTMGADYFYEFLKSTRQS